MGKNTARRLSAYVPLTVCCTVSTSIHEGPHMHCDMHVLLFTPHPCIHACHMHKAWCWQVTQVRRLSQRHFNLHLGHAPLQQPRRRRTREQRDAAARPPRHHDVHVCIEVREAWPRGQPRWARHLSQLKRRSTQRQKRRPRTPRRTIAAPFAWAADAQWQREPEWEEGYLDTFHLKRHHVVLKLIWTWRPSCTSQFFAKL